LRAILLRAVLLRAVRLRGARRAFLLGRARGAGFGRLDQTGITVGVKAGHLGRLWHHFARLFAATVIAVLIAVLAAILGAVIRTALAALIVAAVLVVLCILAILPGIALLRRAVGVALPSPATNIALLPVIVAVIAAWLLPALGTALFLFGRHLAHRFAQHAGIVLGMLHEVLVRHAVIRQLRVAGEVLVLFDDLLRRTAHLALGTRRVEYTVDDVAEGARAVLL